MTYIYMKHCFKEFELHAEEFIEKYYWSDPDGPTKPKLAEWPYRKDDICFTNSVKWAGESERVDIFIDRCFVFLNAGNAIGRVRRFQVSLQKARRFQVSLQKGQCHAEN